MTDQEPGSRRAARGAETAPSTTENVSGPTRGLAALWAKHPNALLFSALGVIFVLLGTGAVFAGVATASAPTAIAQSNTPTPTPDLPRPVPDAVTAATALRTCSIDELAKDPRLLTFQGAVVHATTGEVLFDRSGDKPAATASVLKVLTAAAALSTLGPDYRMTTRVYEGSEPGTIVLVGGGDPTLSALPAGAESVYGGAPKLSALAAEVAKNWAARHPVKAPPPPPSPTQEPEPPGEEDDEGDSEESETEDSEIQETAEPAAASVGVGVLPAAVSSTRITKVILDASLWDPADKWDASWARSEQTIGYHSEVTALMVDGDRADPRRGTSPRSTDPIGRAGDAFVRALRQVADVAPNVTVQTGRVPGGAHLLGQVQSQPIRVLIGQMLPASDNTLAETIARVVSKEAGGGGSAASLTNVFAGALSKYGLDATGVSVRDGSGLSANNAVPPLFVAQLMSKVFGGKGGLNIILDTLPVSGQSGTLAGRFTGANSVARGAVQAKTGWIDSARTLAGIAAAKDGAPLAFAFYALGPVQPNAMEALDTVATGIYACGNNLSNN